MSIHSFARGSHAMAESILSPELDAASLKGGAFLFVPVGARPFVTPEKFGDDQRQFFRTGHGFATSEVAPVIPRLDKVEHALLRELLVKAGELGLVGVDVAEDLGGLGLDKVDRKSVV